MLKYRGQYLLIIKGGIGNIFVAFVLNTLPSQSSKPEVHVRGVIIYWEELEDYPTLTPWLRYNEWKSNVGLSKSMPSRWIPLLTCVFVPQIRYQRNITKYESFRGTPPSTGPQPGRKIFYRNLIHLSLTCFVLFLELVTKKQEIPKNVAKVHSTLQIHLIKTTRKASRFPPWITLTLF